MAWDGKVTNVGLSLLEQWGTGSQTLHIDKATIGTGTVPSASLIASTTVAGEIGETPIAGSSVVTGGIQYQVQVQTQTAAYTLHQIGVWGHLGDSGTATLIAVFQEADGINIPAETDEPGYALTVYCTVAMSNTGSITINLSGGAYATLDTMNAALALKAPIASPALTGTPTAPTAAAGTNTTQIATTAFVQTGLAGKQNTLTFDATPTSGSTNPVTSGGVYAKIGAVGSTPLQTQVTDLGNMDTAIERGIAILATGNTHAAITSRQYVFVRNHTTLANGLYKASANIAANAALSTSNLVADSSGGLNSLKAGLDTLNSNMESRAKIAYLSWGTSLSATGFHHGILLGSYSVAYIVWFSSTNGIAIRSLRASDGGKSETDSITFGADNVDGTGYTITRSGTNITVESSSSNTLTLIYA
jgi:hypothetical protein